MRSRLFVHALAIITLLLGVWLFADLFDSEEDTVISEQGKPVAQSKDPEKNSQSESFVTQPQITNQNLSLPRLPAASESSISDSGADIDSPPPKVNVSNVDPEKVLDDYMQAWRNRNREELKNLWTLIANCEKCLAELVDMVANQKLEEGMLLETAIKMAALDTDAVLPVFDALIDPAGKKSTSIILSEKLIKNGRPEFVGKVFDLIYRARQSGYENFAQQLTWVISKLENPAGIEPILDTITGRKATSPELSKHVTNVYSKVVRILPDDSKAGEVIANYYITSNSQEQQQLWPVVKQHGETLVSLAVDADKNGLNYNVQKYAEAMTELPHLDSVQSLMELHTSVEYAPNYLKQLLSERVVDNPTIKVLHKLEDYMRNPNVKLESRLFAAEGLLAVRQNRQARYILEKVINNTQEPDAELQAYIGGRL